MEAPDASVVEESDADPPQDAMIAMHAAIIVAEMIFLFIRGSFRIVLVVGWGVGQ